MGITNFIKRVSDATEEIKEAITRKGVVVSECDSLEDMPDRIDEINTQGGGGTSVYTFLVFTSSKNTPSSPTGGSLSEDLQFIYPSNWSDGSGLTSDIWVSYADFTTNGIVGSWHTPVKMSGSSSSSSVDLSDYALKSWVLEQIKESIKPGGVIDLSKYATKEYVDQKISEIDPSGGTGIYVKSINGSTGVITFNGDGVSQSGNTFTFNAGSGSGTTTSINGETGELTFTGDGVSQSGKTFTFSGGGTSGGGVISLNSIKGVITLKGDDNGSVTIARGNDGQSLIFSSHGGGTGGPDGDTIRTFLIYKNTDSNTEKPEITTSVGNEPYWDINSGELKNCPEGWATDDVYEKGKYTWIAFGFFSKNSAGAMQGSWEGPFCMTGEPGKPGKDGDNYEFIYALTANSGIRPKYPTDSSELKNLFDNVEQGDSSESYYEYQGQKWYDRAQSIDPVTYKTCWVAQRMKAINSSEWVYTSPILWANWGSDGIDGDGVEYIFFLTDDAHQSVGKWTSDAPNFKISYTNPGTVNGVSTEYDNKVDDWVPKGWTDEPQDVAPNKGFYEFCSIRKSKDGIWQEFSEPSLWSKSPMDGKDGADIEYVYATTNDDLQPSQVSVDNDAANADGAHTKDEYLPIFIFNGNRTQSTDDPVSVSSTTKYQWVSIRRKKRGATEWGDFSHPALWSMYGSGESSGGDVYVPVTLFTAHNSYENEPTVPSTVSTYDKSTKTVVNPPAGWDMNATKTVENPYIWRINGVFSETSGKQIGSWQGPYCVTGAPGPSGKDGDEIEAAYALTADVPGAGYPKVDTSGTDPNGKTNSDAGYLPKIVFSASETTQTVAEKESPTSTKAYLYGTERRKNGDNLYAWSSPYLVSMWTYAGLDDTEIDKITQQVSAKVADQVDQAYQKAEEVENRLNQVVDTDATFTTDAAKGIIAAITTYDGDDKTSFADSIIDAGNAKITQAVGAAVDDKISGAGLTLDGLSGMVQEWGVYKDGDENTEGTLNYVNHKLNALDVRITTAATNIDTNAEGIATVQNAMTEWDAKTATLESNVSKSQYIWVKEDKNTIIGQDDNGEDLYKIIDDRKYDPDGYDDLSSYDSAMTSAGWTKKLLATALSQIRQTPGQIDLTAIDGDQAAAIIIKAKDEQTDKSQILMNAQNVYFSGDINANGATFENARIINGGITNGDIQSAEINDCTINSTLHSTNYDNGTGELKTKEGFLFDPQKNQFAIYSKSPKWTSGDPDVVISSNEFKIPEAYIDSLITSEMIAGKIDANALEIASIQSKPFVKGTSGYKLSSDGDNATFEFYGKDTEGNEFSLTNEELVIPSAYIKNLSVGNFSDFYGDCKSAIDKYMSVSDDPDGNKILNISNQVKTLLAKDTDFVVKTVTTTQDDFNVYVGGDYVNAVADNTIYCASDSRYAEKLTSPGTSVWTIDSNNSITISETSDITISAFDINLTNFVVGTHTGMTMQTQAKLVNTSTGAFVEGSAVSGVKDDANGTAEGKHNYLPVKYDGRTLKNVPAGTYKMQIWASIKHSGKNLWSKSWCGVAFDSFTMQSTINISNEKGIFIGANGIKLDDGVHQANINLSDNSNTGFSTKGFVMSPDDSILKIKRATEASDCTDDDTLYFILN